MAKEILTHYSPEEITVSIAGLHTIDGFLEGTFVGISRDAPLFSSRESADGRVSRTRNPSTLHTVSLTLMSTSESNEILTRLSLIDHATHTGRFPLFIKDNLGSSLLFSSTSWIEDLPNVEFTTSVSSRTWAIKCSQASLFVGGNSEESGLVEDVFNSITGLRPDIRQMFL